MPPKNPLRPKQVAAARPYRDCVIREAVYLDPIDFSPLQ
jgi:hypothetical protein